MPPESVPATGGARPATDDRGSQRTGRDFLFAFHSALRALKLYPLENQAVPGEQLALGAIGPKDPTPDDVSV